MDKMEKLEILRRLTKLSLIDSMKVAREYHLADQLRDACVMSDPKHIYSADYTDAYNYEYQVRYNILRQHFYPAFVRYKTIENDGASLDLFVERFIANHTNDTIERKIKI